MLNSSAPSQHAISKTASLLTAGRDFQHALHNKPASETPHDEDDVHDPDVLDDHALAKVTSAAIRRTHLSQNALREVDPVFAIEPASVVPVSSSDASHPEMISRIMDTLRTANSVARTQGVGTSNLPKLERKLNSIHKQGKKELAVPKPRVVTDKLERAAAYEFTKKDMSDRWEKTVQRNRRVDRLVFPLHVPRSHNRTTGDVAATASKSANPYEEEISNILEEAGVTKKDGENEEDQLSKRVASKAEVLRRRRELAKVRSEMFEYERKMKRIKKIKSKKFRRVMKKEKEKLAATIGADVEGDEEAAIQAERRRVEERVTLRHKNTSKWIKRQLQRGEGKRDADTREAIEEQLRIHEQLKQRQEQEIGNYDSDSDGFDGDDDAADERMATELRELEEDVRKESDPDSRPKKGVMALKFMQTAEEQQRREAVKLLNEMNNASGDEDELEPSSLTKSRQSFKGNAVVDSDDDEDDLSQHPDEDAIEKRQEAEKTRVMKQYDVDAKNGAIGMESDRLDRGKAREVIKEAKKKKGDFTTVLEGRLTADDLNPWLNPTGRKNSDKDYVDEPGTTGSSGIGEESQAKKRNKGQKIKKPKKKGTNIEIPCKVGKDSDASSKLPNNRTKKAQTSESGREEGDLEVEGTTPVVSVPSNEPQLSEYNTHKLDEATQSNDGGKTKKRDRKRKRTAKDREEEDRVRMEEVAAAFEGAGGADLADFQAAKEAEVLAELPNAKSIHAEVLPGWGAWDGAGMSKKAKKKREESAFARAARERLEEARKNAIEARSDRNLQNVIIDQRRSKKATELTMASVPFPFTSRKQWEKEVANPVLPELVSGNAFAGNIRRRVEAKVGSVIEPIQLRSDSEWKQDATALVDRGTGKRGVIDMRKVRAEKRGKARRGLMS